jgi:dihydrofolate reductase
MASQTVYYAAVSLDGFIAEPEEKLTWLMGFEGQDFDGPGVKPIKEDYPAFISEVGAVAMGSKTYEFIVDENWAYGDMPAWVFTHRDLPRMEGAGKLQFTSGSVAELHGEMLAAAGGKDLWVIGGGDLASQYVAAGLLDTVILTVVPVWLGAGLPLFAEPLPKPLRLTEAHPFDSGMARLAYEVQR